jgi:hypothetical protein
MAKKEGIKAIAEVLRGMAEYLFRSDNNYHVRKSLAYCPQCRAISAAGEDHQVYLGTDCGGDSFGTEESQGHCLLCDSGNYVEVSIADLGKLKDIYGRRTPEVLLEGIENGLGRMNHPSLYNENLPELMVKWRRIPRAKKIEQIRELLKLNSRIALAKSRREKLEKILSGGENESLS